MRKGWFWIYVITYFLLVSLQTYASLSESEKSKFNSCPLLTFINITGEGIIDRGSCYAVTIEQGYNNLNLTTSCDEDYIEPVYTSTRQSKVKQKGELYILYDFVLGENQYYLSKCIKNGTPLEKRYIYVNVKTITEIETEAKIQKLLNKTELNTNKSEQILREINDSKGTLIKINTTTQQTNTTLTKVQKSQNCKEKFGLIPEVLLIFFNIILAFIGYINKRNKKLRQKLIILGVISLILWSIVRVSIMFIC